MKDYLAVTATVSIESGFLITTDAAAIIQLGRICKFCLNKRKKTFAQTEDSNTFPVLDVGLLCVLQCTANDDDKLRN